MAASLQLTTLARLKAKSNLNITGTDYDAKLTGLIAEVSQKVEQYIGFRIKTDTYTEVLDIDHLAQRTLHLDQRPINSITSIKVRSSISTDWANVDAIDSDDYEFEADPGVVHMNFASYVGRRTVQVIYVAGLEADQATLQTNYLDIVQACERQITHEYKRDDDLEGRSVNVNGVQQTTTKPVMLLPAVKETLDHYKRWRAPFF